MTPDMEVTTIVTTLDNLLLLRMQLPILLEECGQVVVVVNGSVDGSWEWLRDNPNDKLFPVFKENEGAGPGRNKGLEEWDKHITPYTLMLDGGILPLRGSVAKMKRYLLDNPDVEVVSPEVATSFVTDLGEADRIFVGDITRERCFPQRSLSSTAYALCRASAWRVRFSEEGPFGMAGWGVDDNDMAYRWNEAGVLHHDFILPIHVYRHRSGSFKRIQNETGVSANGYGSVYEMRNVKLWQDWPQYMQYTGQIEVSVVIPAWNEYPLFAKAVKILHQDLKDIPHEIIVVNNGSTDETTWWLDTFALRQPNGDATVDAATGKVLRRGEHPELEPVWTGDVIRVDFQENRGLSAAVNAGMARARGRYLSILDGDILPVRGTYPSFKHLLDTEVTVDWAGINPWVAQPDNDDVPPFEKGFENLPRYGAGELLGGYCLFRRAIWDAGCRFPEDGPFKVVGCGYEDLDFAGQVYSKGFRAWYFQEPGYFHRLRNFKRSGHVDESTKYKNLDDRMKWCLTKWHGAKMVVVHHHDQPPPRHLRRVAVVCNPKDFDEIQPGLGLFVWEALNEVCRADSFALGEEPDGYDDYLYLVDYEGDVQPKHPSVLWAIDMHVPSWYFGPPLDRYVEIAPSFDRVFAARPCAVDYFKEHGIAAEYLPVAASPKWHHPVEGAEPQLDWTAIWHNCGPRPELVAHMASRFPNGLVAYASGESYSRHVANAQCALNKSRLGETTMRVFETMVMGVPLVTDRVPETAELFQEGEHYLGYETAEECGDQVAWVLSHPSEAAAMATRAQVLVLRRHTYFQRILKVFGEG